MNIKEIQQQNINEMIPYKWDIYDWSKSHPKTTISAAVKRVEKIFDLSDVISLSWSGGKDSSASAYLAMLELNLRRLRVKNHIDRDGNNRIDPLDAKWRNRNLFAMMTDAEVVFTETNNYSQRMLQKMGPNGKNLLNFSWICLELLWQSGVSFSNGFLTSWDRNSKNIWLHDMPTKEELGGFDVVKSDTLDTENPFPLQSFTENQKKLAKERGIIIKVKPEDIIKGSYEGKLQINNDGTVDAIPNFGRGFYSDWYERGMHEKDCSHDFSAWSFQTSDMAISDVPRDELKKEINKRYPDLKDDVWSMTGNKNGVVSSALVSLRAEESLDRRVILAQGEYSTGQYSNAGGVNNCSPVFDFKTSDIWRLFSATDWDVNKSYEQMYEAGIPIANQRIGSLLNYCATKNIGMVKALEPELYSRITSRFNNVEFMSQFGNSKGYYNIAKPKDANWDGANHFRAGMSKEEYKQLSDKYEDILKELDIPYERKGNNFISTEAKYKDKPWYILKDWLDANKDADPKLIDKVKKLNRQHITWRDYCLNLLNSSSEPARTNWREKLVTSIIHWSFNTGAFMEGNLAGLEILSELPNDLTEKVVDDHFEYGKWYFNGRLKGSKKRKILLGKYSQESLAEEGHKVLKYIINHWNENYDDNMKYNEFFRKNEYLAKMWKFAQKSGGEILYPDEILTYSLEKETHDERKAFWCDVTDDIFTNGYPSKKYADYYKTKTPDPYPVANYQFDKDKYNTEEWWTAFGISLKDQIDNFERLCEKYLKQDLSNSPSWKRMCVVILQNDLSAKYAGFSQTLRERQLREDAINAFDRKAKQAKMKQNA